MSTSNDPRQSIAAWLEAEAPDGAPARLIEASRERIRTTPQRRAWWPAWRFAPMNNALRIAAVAVVVVVVAFIGIRLLPDSGTGGPASPTPTPTATATPISTPMSFPTLEGQLEAGTYVTNPFYEDPEPYRSIGFTFTVPLGWRSVLADAVVLGPVRQESDNPPDGLAILFANVVDGLFSDPCNADYSNGATDVAVGSTVDDLASAFAAQTAYDSTTPTEVTLSGYSGKKMDLTMPSDVDFATCNEGGFFIWEGSIYAQGPGNVWHLWILDVEGSRIVIFIQDFAGTPDADQAEAQAIVDSLQIQP